MLRIPVLVLVIAGIILVQDADAMVGGSNTADGAYPSSVSYRYNGIHNCGATIINEKWILIVGHAVYNSAAKNMSVYVGSNYLTTGGTEYFVKRVIIHEDFNRLTVQNDIALMELFEPLTFSSRVSVASLTNVTVANGIIFVVPGWGKTSLISAFPEQQQFLEMKKISRLECFLKGMPSWSTDLCGESAPHTGLCSGDSGTPGLHQDTVVSIVSYAAPCAGALPNVFVDVSQYYNWIQNKMAS